MLVLLLRPHVGRDGVSTDRFDAYLDDELICTPRQPRLDGARKLLDLGYPPDTLINVRHEGKAYDSWAEAKPIGELAKRMIREGEGRYSEAEVGP